MRSGTSHSSLDLAGLQSVSTLSICNLHLIRAAFHLSYLHTHTHTPSLLHYHIHTYCSTIYIPLSLRLQLTHQSPSPFRPCIAICLAHSASANPPAILPLLSLAPVSLTPLPLYPLSLLSGAGLRAAGRLAGGAGGLGFPLAGRAGAGGGAACASRYALGAQPEADLSRREASHQPGGWLLVRGCGFWEGGRT